ncbi:uncharacterized protein LOC121387162 [Gigantopelta aegis]|uniref:uncharacterized protein LOC121387162 n=1 Tax=Gigantopelta aegis TaxID=1735272 RepID=UPI001B888D5C|nr:uncharacterized protein LOC121387162 [Gigantopelta aegis]
MAEMLSMNKELIRKILIEDLSMRKVCAKSVPKLLTDEQNQKRVDICTDLFERIEQEANLLDCVITGDEAWVFQYDLETKRQSLQWTTITSPRPKKARISRSKVKTMLIVFLTLKVLCTMNIFHQSKWSTKTFTEMF